MPSGSNEASVQNKIRLAFGNGDTRLFRNNTGALTDIHGRLVTFGLCRGSSDLIGFRSIEITPEMVGKKLAVFTAIEVKDKGKATKDQNNFLQLIKNAGGFSGVARSVKDAALILKKKTLPSNMNTLHS